MNRQIAIILTFFMILCLVPEGSVARAATTDALRWPGRYGYVDFAALSSFAPLSSRDAFRSLRRGDLASAQSGLEKGLALDPHSLAIWVGLVQSDPGGWQAALAQVSRTRDGALPNDESRFKRAVLTYYLCMSIPHQALDEPKLKVSELLFWQSWKQSNNVLSGLFLADALGKFGNRSGDPSISRNARNDILEQSLYLIGGQDVYQSYKQAEGANWELAPPPASSVAPDKQRELLAIVSDLRSWAGARFSVGIQVRGVWTYTPPSYTAEQTRKMHFFEVWYSDLENRIHTVSIRE